MKSFRKREHSDSIPLESIVPSQELRLFLDGKISAKDYDKAIRRGEQLLTYGYQNKRAKK